MTILPGVLDAGALGIFFNVSGICALYLVSWSLSTGRRDSCCLTLALHMWSWLQCMSLKSVQVPMPLTRQVLFALISITIPGTLNVGWSLCWLWFKTQTLSPTLYCSCWSRTLSCYLFLFFFDFKSVQVAVNCLTNLKLRNLLEFKFEINL